MSVFFIFPCLYFYLFYYFIISQGVSTFMFLSVLQRSHGKYFYACIWKWRSHKGLLQKTDDEKAVCTLCGSNVKFSRMGLAALLSHSEGSKHKEKANRKGGAVVGKRC